jgi:hypothetical protein
MSLFKFGVISQQYNIGSVLTEQYASYIDSMALNSNLSNVITDTAGNYRHVFSTNGTVVQIRKFDLLKNSVSLTTVYTAPQTITQLKCTMFENGSILMVVKDSDLRLIVLDNNNNILNSYIAESGTNFFVGNISHNRVIDQALVGIFNPGTDNLKAWKVTNTAGLELVNTVAGQADITETTTGRVGWLGNDRVAFFSISNSAVIGSAWDMTNSVWVRQNGFIAGALGNITLDEVKVFSSLTKQWCMFVFNSNDGFVNYSLMTYEGDENYSRLFTEYGEDANIKVLDANVDLNDVLSVLFIKDEILYKQKYDIAQFAPETNPIDFTFITILNGRTVGTSIDIDNPYTRMPISIREELSLINRIIFIE